MALGDGGGDKAGMRLRNEMGIREGGMRSRFGRATVGCERDFRGKGKAMQVNWRRTKKSAYGAT